MIHVVSTGYLAPTKQRCISSVKEQRGRVDWHHTYIDADRQRPPRTVSENQYRAIRESAPTDIIVLLDGDDWLANTDVLSLVRDIYDDPKVWLTYGSYRCADGRPGHAARYQTENYRAAPWLASHLKTFRAALYHRLVLTDFAGPDGDWISGAHDCAAMIPMLEMAGADHSGFVSTVLCVYNTLNSLEHTGGAAAVRRERDAEAFIRSKPRKEPLRCL